MQVSNRDTQIAKLRKDNQERPIAPSTQKRRIIVPTTRNGPPAQASVTINQGDFAEMKADLSWTKFTNFKVSIDRVDQGRVAVIDGLDERLEWPFAHLAQRGRIRTG